MHRFIAKNFYSSTLETPGNFCEIGAFVKTEIKEIKSIFFFAERVFFYDTCSFQRHSNLADKEKSILIKYFKDHGIVIFISRCILMELASDRHKLTHNRGARIIVFSTPKLVQYTFQEHAEISEDEMINLISQGVSGNIVVMGTTAFDLKVDEKISMTGRELV